MKIRLLAGTCLFTAINIALATTPEQAPKTRGQLLYENHCHRCHEISVHARHHNKVSNLDELNRWVRMWANEEKLDWKQDEVRDVVDYLNQEYYKFR